MEAAEFQQWGYGVVDTPDHPGLMMFVDYYWTTPRSIENGEFLPQWSVSLLTCERNSVAHSRNRIAPERHVQVLLNSRVSEPPRWLVKLEDVER